MPKILFSFCLALVGGCGTTQPIPQAWVDLTTVEHVPLGRFANEGVSSDPKMAAPTLSALLFDNLLEGFDIDNVVFARGDSDKRIRVRPHVADVAIREERTLDAETSKDGPTLWTARTRTRHPDGYDVAASVLWTGGALMPIANWKTYRFQLGSGGDLVIRLNEKEIVNFFYLFPVPFTDEVWLRYPVYATQPVQDAP